MMILSGNSIEHALLALTAMHVGIPYAPIAPSYSLSVREYGAMVQNFDSVDLVGVCATGDEALKIVLSTHIDIFLAGLRMLPLNGVQPLQLVKQQAPSTRVIVFSSYELEEEIYQALRKGPPHTLTNMRQLRSY